MDSKLLIRKYDLRTGDRLITKKGPFSRHHSIFVHVPGNEPLVAENQAGKGVQYITLHDFVARPGSGKIEVQKFGETEAAREKVVPQINALIGARYDLVNFNC